MLVVARVEVAPPSGDLIVGQTLQLSATPKTTSGVTVTGRAVAWSSSNPSIASVSGSGLVTGLGVGGPVQVQATVDGIVGSASVSVRAVPIDRITVEPGEFHLLVGASQTLTATAFDANGSQLNGRDISWSSSDNNIATVTVTGVVIAVREGGPVTITASAEGKTATASVSVSTRPPTRLGFATQPGNVVAGQFLPSIKVDLQDDLLTTVLGATNSVTIALAANPGGATLSGVTTRNAVNGTATFTDLTLDRVGTGYSLQVSSPGLVPAISNAFSVSAGSVSQASFATPPPDSARSGAPLSPAPVIQLRDGSGNPVHQAGVTITANAATTLPDREEPAPGAAVTAALTLTGNMAITNDNGVATFANLSVSGATGEYNLIFTAPGMAPLTSGTIELLPGSGTTLFIATQPGVSAQSNTPLSIQPAIRLHDAFGNDVPQSGVVVTASLASGSGDVGGNTTANTNGSGLAAFLGLSISGPVGTYTLRFSAPDYSPVVSSPVIVGPGAPSQLAMVTQPTAALASGTLFTQQPVVRLQDASGNSVGLAGITVTATVFPDANLLGGIFSTTDATGLAPFAGLGLSGLAGNYTLTFRASGISPASSVPIALGVGVPTRLTFTQQPSTAAQSGVSFPQQPALQLRDGGGNPVTQQGVAVNAALSGPAGGSLIGSTTATTGAGGLATFAGLGVAGPVGNYQVAFTANSGALLSGPSGVIALGPGPASQLVLTQQPVGGASGGPLATQPVLAIRDAQGNTVTGDNTTQVSVTISSGVGGNLSGTLTRTAAGGVVTFNDLSLAGTAGQSYQLRFGISGNPVPPALSGSVVVSAGTASQLVLTQQPAGGLSGAPLPTQPVLAIRDAQGNTVLTDNSTQVSVAIFSGGGGTLGGTLTRTAVNGVVTFTGLTLSGTVGTNYVLRFTSSPALTAVNSGNVMVTAGTATQLSLTQQPAGGASGAPLATQPVVAIRDAQGNTVTTDNSTQVTVAIASGTGGTLGGTLTRTAANGVVTFSGVTLAGTVGTNYTLGFSSTPALTPVTSGNVAVTAGAATQLAITQQPVGGASGAVLPTQPIVAIRDAQGNTVTGDNTTQVTIAIQSGAGGALGGTLTRTAVNGVVSFTAVTLAGTVGTNYVLRFTSSPALTAVNSSDLTLTAGAASQLVLTQQPVGATSGTALATQPVVAIRDAQGNTVTTDNTTQVTVAIFSGAGGTLGGTVTGTAVNGVATFTNVTLAGAVGTNYVLRFTSSPALTPVNSSNVTVTAGNATQLVLTQQPVGGPSGSALATQPVVAIRDAQGNTVATDNTTQVTAGILSGVGGTLGGSVTGTAVNGVVTFTNLTMAGTVGTNYVLQFTSSPALTPANSNSLTVTPGAGTQLVITQQPAGGASGGTLTTQPIVAVRDAQGNTVTGDNTTQVTVAIFSGAGGTLGGTLTRTVANGVATFTGVTLSGTVGTNYTLRFTSVPALAAATSGNVSVTPGAASQLTITQQPVGGASGAVLATQPIVAIRDAQGNTVTSDNSTQVTVAISSGVGGSLGGTLARTAIGGVVSFTGVTLSGGVGTNYALQFTSNPVLAPAISNGVTLTAGAANKLGITTQPVGGSSGVALATQPVIAIQDAQGNTVTGDNTTQVTVQIGSGAGGALGGTLTRTASGGVVTFTGVSLSGVVGTSYVLQFTSSPVLTSISSNNVTVTAGTANKLGITQQPVGGTSGAVLATQPIVVIQDAQGNTVTGDNTTQVTVQISSGAGGGLGGTLTRTASGGVVTFTGLTLSGVVGTNYVLQFTSNPVLTSVSSNNVTVTAGAANKLGITTQPVGAASGAALATQPIVVIQDAQGNTVTSDNTTQVTVQIGSGAGGSLGGTLTRTAASGVVTFTGVTLSGVVGTNYVLQFTSSPVLTSVNSNNVTVTAGAANKLGITQQPVGGASGAALATQPIVVIQDAQGNTVTGDNTTQVSVGILSGAGGSLGGTLTRTASSGVVAFTGVTLSGVVGTNYVLQFTSSPALTAASSNNVTVTAGTPSKLGITTQPVGGASGAALATQPVVAIQDAGGNTVTSDNTTQVTVAILSGAGGSLGGTLTRTASGGVVTFTGVTLSGVVGTNYVLRFTSSPVLTAVNSGNVTVTAGAASQLAITQPPTGGASGAALSTQPIVAIRDAQGNTVTTDNGTQVSVALFSGAGGAVGGTTTVTAVNGVATFTGVTLSGTVGTNYVLRFTSSPVLTPVNSGNVTVTAGTATQLAITTQPVGGANGATLATQPAIAIRDAQGNTVTTDNGTQVSVALFSGAGGAVGGTTTVTAVNGVATFTNVTLSGTVGTNYVLRFTSSPVLTPVNSGNVTVTAGAANKLGITTQPVGGASGAALATQPIVVIQDAQGNTVTGDNTTQVTVAILSGAGGSLGGTLTRTAVGGVVTFTGVTLSGGVGTNYVLQFTSNPVLASVISNGVTLTAGVANKLGITTQPVGGSSGGALATQPVIAIQDAQGNTVTGDNTTQVTVAILSGAGGSLGGTLTRTASGGVVTFTGVTLSGVVGTNYVLRFTSSPVLTAVNSGNVTVTAGAASQLAITQPPTGGASGAALSTQPIVAIRDAQGNTVTTDNGTQVSVALFSGAGGAVGGTTTVTAVNGVATFTGVTLSGTVGTNYVLRFTSSPVLTPVNSGNVTVTAGTATQLAITTQPVGGANGATLATQPAIAIRDAQGNTVTTDNGTQVSVALFSGAGGAVGGTTTVTAVNGVATFTNVTLSGTVGTNYVLRFTSSPVLTAVNSGNVTVTAGAASQLAITQPPTGGASGAALSTQPIVAIRDAQGNTVTTDNGTQVSVALFSGAGGAVGGTTTVTAVNGVATFTNVTLSGTVGTNYVLRFTSSPVLTAVNSGNVTVTAGAASQLAITQPPTGGASGAALSTQPIVAIRDAQGNTVTTDNGTQVSVALFSGAGGAVGGTTTVTAVNGVATFTGVTLSGTVGTNYVLRFTSSPVLTAVNSGNVTVTAGAASQLAITQPPTGGASGAALSTQPIVAIRDAQGNTVTTDNGTQVSVALFSGAGGAVGGTTTVTAVNGVATFTNVTLSGTVGTNYVLRFTSSPVLTPVNSGNVTVTAGTATQLAITTQPVGGANGATLATQPAIAIRDAQGNTVTTDNGTQVSVALFSGAGGAVGGTTTVTAVNGVATFTNVTLSGTVGTNYVLRFTSSPVLTPVNSGNVTVTAGAANKLGITTQPVGGASGAALATQPIVVIQDAQGNTVTGDNTTQVTVAILSGAGGSLGGTLTRTAVGGVVTFTGVTLSGGVGTNYVLQFTSNPVLASVISNGVTLTAGVANKLGITTQPVGGSSGGALATQPVIAIQDAQGNTVTGDNTTQVTVAILSGAGGGLGGTLTRTAVGGVVTFTGVTLSGVVGTSYVLQFTSSPVLTSVSSTNVTVTAGAANKLGITQQPVGGASGAALATQPVIAIQDAQGNTVTGDNATQVTLQIGSGAGGALGGTLTRTAVGGVVTFTNAALSGVVGTSYVLQFTSSPVLTPVNSGNVTVTAGTATQLAITTQPVGGANGATLATQPAIAIRDAQGNTVTTDNGTQVSVALFSGAGGAVGGTTTVTAVNGVATFTNVTLSGTVGTNYVLRFTSSPVLTPVNSGNVTVTAGTATQLAITTQPVGGASGAALATQPVVAIQDAGGNTVTSDNTTLVTVAILSGAGGSLGGTLTRTAVGGVVSFTGVTLSGVVGTNYVLQFTSSPALTATGSNNVTVTLGAATQLAITTQPVGGASGGNLATQPVVAIRDGGGNTVTTDNTTQVTVAILSGAGGGLGGTLTRTAVGGVVTFTGVTLSGVVGTSYVLQFTSSPVLTSVSSTNVTVTAGAANKLGITTQPVGGASGGNLSTQPVVAIRDGGGNTVTSDNTTQVTVAIFSGAGGALGGTQTVTAVNGVASFSTVTLSGVVGTNYVLRFTSSPALTAVNSGNVTVTAGTATQLAITTQPVGGANGATLATQPAIAIRDAQGNTVTTDNGTQVSVALFSGAGGAVGGTTTVTAVNGVATFTNVTLSGTVGTNYVLRFTSSPVLTPVNSGNVTVTAGTATQLAITTQPVGGASGAALATQPVIAIQDASGNTVTGDNTTLVTVAILSGAGGSLGGTLTRTAGGGVVSFTGVTLSGVVGTNYVLQFTSSPALTATGSNNVTVTLGAATQLAITTQPVGGASGGNLATQPVVLIRDSGGNTVTSDNATQVSVAILSGAGGALGGTQTVTAVNGVATFTNLTLAGTVGTNYVLQFTSSPVLTAANSNSVTVTAGTADHMTFSTAPATTATTAVALNPQPALQLRDMNNNAVASAGVSISVTLVTLTGSGILGGTATAITAANGIATFTDLVITGTGTFQLQFAGTGLAPATSAVITVSP